MRVAVTGAGSIVGQGIVKSLRLSRLPAHIIATDIAPLNAALYRADEAMLLPPVEREGALEVIIGRLKAARADAVMIGSEFDLEFFSEHKPVIERETGCLVVASPPETVAIAGDKWLTTEFLRENRLPYAEAALAPRLDEAVAWARTKGFPIVLKPRTGTSARHVHVIQSEDELRFWHPSVPNPMLQKLAGPVRAQLGNEYRLQRLPLCGRKPSWPLYLAPDFAGRQFVDRGSGGGTRGRPFAFAPGRALAQSRDA